MSNRNARPGKLVLLLAAFAFLAGCQPGTADIENTGRRAKAKDAEAKDAEAQHSLGRMYVYGEEVPHNLREAAKWYRKAADQGHPEAQYDLGLMYARGEGSAAGLPGSG